MPTRRSVLKTLAVAPVLSGVAAAQAPPGVIRHVDIIHHSHTDVGYTDLPSVCRDLQVRFLDAAIDLCLADPRFRWTTEAMVTVDDWWQASSPQRRNQLLGLVRRGQVDAMALPFNQAPFQGALQWRQALEWVPRDVWRDLRPRAAMQNDVNGFPRAGALRLLDLGIHHLLMGINSDSGGPPFRRPSAFWWKMPDGRRMFVWLGDHYGVAYSFFEPKRWISGQPKGADTSLRPPRAGDHLRTDETSLRAAHRHFTDRLRKLEADGYNLDRLILSYTNQWRYDNDPPFPPLPDFVEAWNKLGLQPPLRLTTATEAVRDMEASAGSRVPEHQGEWTDWWANGDASGPREVAASRKAKRSLAAALSPVWGPLPAAAQPRVAAMLKDLCLFDEHTWGANISISQPDHLDTLGQYNEKSLLAYRPMGHAEALLGRRAHARLDGEPEGLYVTNTARTPFSGWVSFPAGALRGEFRSVTDPKTSRTQPLGKAPGGAVRFWMDSIPPLGTTTLKLSTSESGDTPAAVRPSVETGAGGWPVSAAWPGMKQPLFGAGLGDVLAVAAIPPADRRTMGTIHNARDAAAREELRARHLRTVPATPGETRVEETPHTLVYVQPFDHPRLEKAERRLELWKSEPRARLTVRFDRLSSTAPEKLYVQCAFPAAGVMPKFSNGGIPFVPYRDQLEGTCRDYYAIDGWAQYETPDGSWLWVSRDAPMVAVGGHHTLARLTAEPADPHRLLAMVFDNFWHTNFVANSHGAMEFQFDLAWREKIADPGALAETLVSEPVVLLNPGLPESPAMRKHLFQP